MAAPIICVRDLVFEYPGKRALHGVSFDIEAGSVTALVGPNGAGKTTLMRCLAALESPFSGTITVCGLDTQVDPRACHKKLGYLSDFFGLYDDLSVRQSLSFLASINSRSHDEIPELVRETASDVELESYLDTLAGNLSRGLRQRLAIGQTIIHQPDVILLDEPASGLDPEARGSLSRLILKLQAQQKTVVVSSHILSELEDYSDSMLTCRDGRIIGQETLRNVRTSDTLRFYIRIADDPELLLPLLEGRENILSFEVHKEGVLCEFTGGEAEQQNLVQEIVAKNLPLLECKNVEKRMHDVYLQQMKSKEDNASS